jgi:hypothetical protein
LSSWTTLPPLGEKRPRAVSDIRYFLGHSCMHSLFQENPFAPLSCWINEVSCEMRHCRLSSATVVRYQPQPNFCINGCFSLELIEKSFNLLSAQATPLHIILTTLHLSVDHLLRYPFPLYQNRQVSIHNEALHCNSTRCSCLFVQLCAGAKLRRGYTWHTDSTW